MSHPSAPTGCHIYVPRHFEQFFFSAPALLVAGYFFSVCFRPSNVWTVTDVACISILPARRGVSTHPAPTTLTTRRCCGSVTQRRRVYGRLCHAMRAVGADTVGRVCAGRPGGCDCWLSSVEVCVCCRTTCVHRLLEVPARNHHRLLASGLPRWAAEPALPSPLPCAPKRRRLAGLQPPHRPDACLGLASSLFPWRWWRCPPSTPPMTPWWASVAAAQKGPAAGLPALVSLAADRARARRFGRGKCFLV